MMKFNTRAIHVGQSPEPGTGSVVVPVFQTSTFAQESPGKDKGYDYARTRNPTREALESCVASLESGKHGLAFASGMAAEDAILHLLRQGDEVVCTDDVYGGTYRLFERIFKKQGLHFKWVDSSSSEVIESEITERTKMVWIETPTNPLLKLTDLEVVVTRARQVGALSVVDNTFATPYFQRPIELGVDIVLHSTTKYIGGHSDVVGGVVVVNDSKLYKRLAFIQNSVGGVPGPWDAWLVLRGIKTLGIRMERHFKNALAAAQILQDHPKVRLVIYPWLPSHPQYELARKQMTGMSGMISIYLDTDLNGTKRFLESVRLFTLAESLGGVESLVEHPAIMTHASLPPEVREKLGIDDALVRLSVGIEDSGDLLDDLNKALKKV